MAGTLRASARAQAARPRSRRPTGPPLGVLAAISLGLALAGLAAALAAGRAFASPFAPTGQPLDYDRHGVALRLSATLLFGSAVPLGIFAATAYTRLLRLGAQVPGPSIGFFGGVAASLMLMLSATTGWVLGHPGVGSDAAVSRALSLLGYVTGGVGFAVGLGLLVAGVAVPALVLRLAPRWVAWTGLAVAAVSEVSFLAMALPGLQVLLPVGRYAGLAWLVGIGCLLPHGRPTAHERQP